MSSSPNILFEAGHDFFSYLVGSWKRNLVWKEFGGNFEWVRTSNTVVLVEEFHRTMDQKNPSGRYLKWNFGSSLSRNELRFGYVMKFFPINANGEVYFEWDYCGTLCTGEYIPLTGVAVLHFFQKTSTSVVTYRCVDQDTMVVCVVEIDKNRDKSSIQYGNMLRVDPSSYSTSQKSRDK